MQITAFGFINFAAKIIRASVLFLSVCVAMSPSIASSQSCSELWQEMYPAPRYLSAMAYDSARKVMVLFGGFTGSAYSNETWEWNGSDWILKQPAQSPEAMFSAAAAFDSNSGKTILFGGYGNSGYSDHTWEWDGTNWTDKSTSTKPSGRVRMSLNYDSAKSVMVMFGGT